MIAFYHRNLSYDSTNVRSHPMRFEVFSWSRLSTAPPMHSPCSTEAFLNIISIMTCRLTLMFSFYQDQNTTYQLNNLVQYAMDINPMVLNAAFQTLIIL